VVVRPFYNHLFSLGFGPRIIVVYFSFGDDPRVIADLLYGVVTCVLKTEAVVTSL
jgi:hypothetical protein